MLGKLKGHFDGQDSLSAPDNSTNSQNNQDSDRRASKSAARDNYDGHPSTDESPEAPPPFPQHEKSAPPAEKTTQPSSPRFSTDFASVSLHTDDRIRLLGLSTSQRDALRNTILRTWPQGIQRERDYHGSWEFKLSGRPWYPTGKEAIYARRLTRGLLMTMYEAGWVLYIATDISRNMDDKDNLFFRHQSPAPAPCEWFSVTFSKGDRIRLIDAPVAVVDDISATLAKETKSQGPYRVAGVHEIKLNGYPFEASGGETMVSRRICLQLFSVLERHGFTLSASMDQKFGGQNGEETDTWHVSRPVGWQPGAPVYHP